MEAYKKGINWYIDYYLPNVKRKRATDGYRRPKPKKNKGCKIARV